MSVKNQLAAVVSTLPEGLSFDQAMERIRQIYKIRQGLKARATAKELFADLGPWEGESADELEVLLRQARQDGGSKEPPAW